MKKHLFLENFKRAYVSVVLFTLLFSCAVLVFINYCSDKISPVNGNCFTRESHNSKSHKESTHAETIGFSKNLGGILPITETINEWATGFRLMNKLASAGNNIPPKINFPCLNTEIRQKVFSSNTILNSTFSVAAINYTAALNEDPLKKGINLLIVNIFFTLIIISSLVIYHTSTVKKLIRSKKETEIQNDDLKIANKELDRVVYSVSHDLRSPILSVKGLIEIAQEEENVSRIKEYLTMMNQSLTQQNQFISDIIDYCRNKRKQVCNEPVDLNHLIDEVTAQHQYIKEAHTITVKKNILTNEIITDGLRIRIILNNLISNAIKYSDVKKESRQISIRTREKDSSYIIEIEDNGIGIKKEFLGQIFDMFFVTDNATGSGLGLYIAKEAAEYLHGNISADSEENVGTTFTVTIPKPQ